MLHLARPEVHNVAVLRCLGNSGTAAFGLRAGVCSVERRNGSGCGTQNVYRGTKHEKDPAQLALSYMDPGMVLQTVPKGTTSYRSPQLFVGSWTRGHGHTWNTLKRASFNAGCTGYQYRWSKTINGTASLIPSGSYHRSTSGPSLQAVQFASKGTSLREV